MPTPHSFAYLAQRPSPGSGREVQSPPRVVIPYGGLLCKNVEAVLPTFPKREEP